MTWQPPRLHTLTRSWLPFWSPVEEVDQAKTTLQQAKEKAKEVQLQTRIQLVVHSDGRELTKMPTVAQAAEEAEKETKEYWDPILAVVRLVPRKKDVESLSDVLRGLWGVVGPMVVSPEQLKREMQTTVSKKILEMVSVGRDRVVESAEVSPIATTSTKTEYVPAFCTDEDQEMLEAPPLKKEDELVACENCPGCFDGGGCFYPQFTHDFLVESDSESELGSEFDSDDGADDASSSDSSLSSTFVDEPGTHYSASKSKKSTTKASYAVRRNSFGRLRNYNTRILPPPPPNNAPSWSIPPPERRKDPKDFKDTCFRDTYRRRVGRYVKDIDGRERGYWDGGHSSVGSDNRCGSGKGEVMYGRYRYERPSSLVVGASTEKGEERSGERRQSIDTQSTL